jgi:trehalose 6-phosphate synthase/phosphatase
MTEDDRCRMLAGLGGVVKKADARHWAPRVLDKLDSLTKPNTPLLDTADFASKYRSAGKRLIFLDYDGTLTPIVSSPEEARPSERCVDILTRLTRDPKNQVYVISGRSAASLESFLGGVPRLGMSAEHGCAIRFSNSDSSTTWHSTLDPTSMLSWRDKALSTLNHFTQHTPNSAIEEKQFSLTWHYRAADPHIASLHASECIKSLSDSLAGYPVDVLHGKKNVEVRPSVGNKGSIVRSILAHHHGEDCLVVCVGDDMTDEDMFRELSNCRNTVTCLVGPEWKETSAKCRVDSSEQLLNLLHSAVLGDDDCSDSKV